MSLLLLASLAAAAEPTDPAPPDEREPLEVLVVGPGALSDARDTLVDHMNDLGWRSRTKTDGRVVFRGPRAWMGAIVFRPTGDLGFRQPLGLWIPQPDRAEITATPATDVTAMSDNQLAMAGAQRWQGGSSETPTMLGRIKPGTFGPRLTKAAQREVARAVEPDVGAYRRVLFAVALQERLQLVQAELDACWSQGASLDGGAPLADLTARRRALLDFWATRTDTPEGHAVMRLVEGFLRHEVMASEAPATADEIAAAEARRDDGARLQLGAR